MNSDFFQLPKTTQISAIFVALLALVVCMDQVYYWKNHEDYSFGFLVPLFVGYVIYDRWPRIKAYLLGRRNELAAPPPHGTPGPLSKVLEIVNFFAMLGALGLLMIGGILLATQGPSNTGSMAVALGFAVFLLGIAFMNGDADVDGQTYSLKERLAFTFLFLFPALCWLISAPMVTYLDRHVKIILLEKVTVIVYEVFNFLGLVLIREGNVLILPEGQVGVADACSGVRSLTACIFAGSFLAATFLDRFWKKVLLVVIAACLAFITNIGRSLFLTGWAYAYGSDSIEGMVHDVTGYAVLGVTSVLLIALLPIFNYRLNPPEDGDGGFPMERAEQKS